MTYNVLSGTLSLYTTTNGSTTYLNDVLALMYKDYLILIEELLNLSC